MGDNLAQLLLAVVGGLVGGGGIVAGLATIFKFILDRRKQTNDHSDSLITRLEHRITVVESNHQDCLRENTKIRKENADIRVENADIRAMNIQLSSEVVWLRKRVDHLEQLTRGIAPTPTQLPSPPINPFR